MWNVGGRVEECVFGEWREREQWGELDMYCLVWELAWQKV